MVAFGIAGRTANQQASGFDFHLHLGEPQLHSLKFNQRPAELMALLDVDGDIRQGCRRMKAICCSLNRDFFMENPSVRPGR